MISTLQPLRNRYNCPGEVRSMKQPYSYFEPLGRDSPRDEGTTGHGAVIYIKVSQLRFLARNETDKNGHLKNDDNSDNI